MPNIFTSTWADIVEFFRWLFFGRPQVANKTIEDIRSFHARQEALRKLGEELRENWKRMARLEELACRKDAWKTEISELEREQMERLHPQEFRNEQKTLLDEQRMIAEGQRELHEVISQQETTSATGIRYPTAREFSAALQKVQYNELNFHFAIAGSSGCGKSSLINSFLNLNPNDVGAAPTGVTETTLEMGRYPDPGTQPPRPWTVWYDIPGAGTQRISASQYFTAQALFVFDIIIVVTGNRFLEPDCQMIRSCLQFSIPFFIVRSKSDQEITNMMRDEDEDYQGPFNSGELFLRCRKKFREQSQKMITDDLKRADLPDQVLYCVSKRTLRNVYVGFLEQSTDLDDDCHELALVTELMKVVYQRRGGNDNTTKSPENAGLRVLFLPNAATVHELQVELHQQNPGLFGLFVADPRMLSPRVALLSFDPKAAIPSRIVAFRMTQTLGLYTEGSPNGSDLGG